MKQREWHIYEAIAFYQSQGAPHDRGALIELLREVQEEKGGLIPKKSLGRIADAYDIKKSALRDLIHEVAELHLAGTPHELELCGRRDSTLDDTAELQKFIEQNYHVKEGEISHTGDFSYHISHSLKKHDKAPVIKWDGKSYPCADIPLLVWLIEGRPFAPERLRPSVPISVSTVLTEDEEPELHHKEIELNGSVEVPMELTQDEFTRRFLAFIMDNEWTFCGSVGTIVDGHYVNQDGTRGDPA